MDLRTDAGLQKSTLLHRLNLIAVPWGRLAGSGSSRGTFRENWRLRWDPEFSIKLAEALAHGTTVEQASGNAAVEGAGKSQNLGVIADIVQRCLNAGLDEASRKTIALLQARATSTTDIASLAAAVPPLATVLRYGTARAIPADELQLLVVSLVEVVCAGLEHACRSLEVESANALLVTLRALDPALTLLDLAPLTASWIAALRRLADAGLAEPQLRGFAVRGLYERGVLDGEVAGTYMSRALSRAVEPLDASLWLEGFLGEAGHLLLHDAVLRSVLDAWLTGLGDEDFMLILAMLRRAFGTMDRMERRRLLDELRRLVPMASGVDGAQPAIAVTGGVAADGEAPGFAAALPLLLQILGVN